MAKFLLAAILAFLTVVPAASPQQASGHTYIINIWYNGADVIVDKGPKNIKVGDRLEFHAVQGDFILTWVNPFNDFGWTVKSKNGVWLSPPLKTIYGRADCSLNIGGVFIDSEYGYDTPN